MTAGFLHDPRSAAVGELDPLAAECAAARAEIRGRFASAIERARNWTLPRPAGR